jgi:hypothetical protein
VVLVHPGGYGGLKVDDCVVIPGFKSAMCPVWRGDNDGPPPAEEVISNFQKIGAEFPHARVVASTLDAFAEELFLDQPDLPVVSAEIGDTWVHGCASDPLKLATFRAMMRLFAACVDAKRCDLEDPRIKNFTRLFIKNSEHTCAPPPPPPFPPAFAASCGN